MVGPTNTRNEGIIGEGVDLTVEHLGRERLATVAFHLTRHLIETRWRDPNEDPKLHLFGGLKGIVTQWLEGYLVCKGGTFPAQIRYRSLADRACDIIAAAITNSRASEYPVKALLDPYNPSGSSAFVNFTTSKGDIWRTDARRCHVNSVVLDSGWESEFCRVVEAHPRVRAYVKNHNLGLEVPYHAGSDARVYLPDFIVRVDDGHGEDDLLNLVIEIKGFRNEDAKAKKRTIETYWVPGVNALGQYGRWAFAELRDVFEIGREFEAVVFKFVQKWLQSVPYEEIDVSKLSFKEALVAGPPIDGLDLSRSRDPGRDVSFLYDDPE